MIRTKIHAFITRIITNWILKPPPTKLTDEGSEMSKLDEILRPLQPMTADFQKQQIKDLMLELISDLENHYAYYLNQSVGKKRSKFADELRQKVSEL
jgi:hypothetical protein